MASYEGDRLTCWASNQGAHDYRDSVAQALGMEVEDIVIITDIGGGFGAKGLASEGDNHFCLSRLHARPVLDESRTEIGWFCSWKSTKPKS